MAAQTLSFHLKTIANRLLHRSKNPSGTPSVGNPYTDEPEKIKSANRVPFISREESERRRVETENAINELQTFFSEYSPHRVDLNNSRTFTLWLTENGLLPRFQRLWSDKVIFEHTFGSDSSQSLAKDTNVKKSNNSSTISSLIRSRSSAIGSISNSLQNVDMILPLLRQQIEDTSEARLLNAQSGTFGITLDPAQLRTTLNAIAKHVDLARMSGQTSSPSFSSEQVQPDQQAKEESSSIDTKEASQPTADHPSSQSISQDPNSTLASDQTPLTPIITSPSIPNENNVGQPSVEPGEQEQLNQQPNLASENIAPTPSDIRIAGAYLPPSLQPSIPVPDSPVSNNTDIPNELSAKTPVKPDLKPLVFHSATLTKPATSSEHRSLSEAPLTQPFSSQPKTQFDIHKAVAPRISRLRGIVSVPTKLIGLSTAISEKPFAKRTAPPAQLSIFKKQVYARKWMPYKDTQLGKMSEPDLSIHLKREGLDPKIILYRQAYLELTTNQSNHPLTTRDVNPTSNVDKNQPLSTSEGKDQTSVPDSNTKRADTPESTLPLQSGDDKRKSEPESSLQTDHIGHLLATPEHLTINAPLPMLDLELMREAKTQCTELYRLCGESPRDNEMRYVVTQKLYINLLKGKATEEQTKELLDQLTSRQQELASNELSRLRGKIKLLHPITRLKENILAPTSDGTVAYLRDTTTPDSSRTSAPGNIHSGILIQPSLYQPTTARSNSGRTEGLSYPNYSVIGNMTLPTDSDEGDINMSDEDSEENPYQSAASYVNETPESEDYYLHSGTNRSNGNAYPEDTNDAPPSTPNNTNITQQQNEEEPQNKKGGGLFPISMFKYSIIGTFLVVAILTGFISLQSIETGPSSGTGQNLTNNSSGNSGPNVTLQKSVNGSTNNSIKAGTSLTYTITVSVANTPVQEIDIADPIKFNINTAPTQVTSPYTYQNKTLEWKLTSPPQPGQSTTLSFTVVPSDNNTSIYNVATATVINQYSNSGGGVVNIGGNIPSNQATCGGKYSGENFGDPDCSFAYSPAKTYSAATWNTSQWTNVSNQGFINLVDQLDPQNENYWLGIASCESTYNPNSIASNGPTGLFQMGYPGHENNVYDNGHVQWKLQTSNAINYEKNLAITGGAWTYWDCARTVFNLWHWVGKIQVPGPA